MARVSSAPHARSSPRKMAATLPQKTSCSSSAVAAQATAASRCSAARALSPSPIAPQPTSTRRIRVPSSSPASGDDRSRQPAGVEDRRRLPALAARGGRVQEQLERGSRGGGRDPARGLEERVDARPPAGRAVARRSRTPARARRAEGVVDEGRACRASAAARSSAPARLAARAAPASRRPRVGPSADSSAARSSARAAAAWPRALGGARGGLLQRRTASSSALQRRRGQVPGAAVGVLVVALERRRERAVRRPALRRGGRLVRRPSAPAGGGRQAAAAHRDRSPACSASSSASGPAPRRAAAARDDGRALRVVGGRDEHEPLRRAGSRRTRSRKARSISRVSGRASGSGAAPGELRRAEHRRQLQQSEGVAARALDEPVEHRRGRRDARVAGEEHRRIGVEPGQRERRHVGRLEAAHVALAGGEEQHDALRAEPARDEPQRVGRGGVEPVRVVDQAQHRPPLGEPRTAATGTPRRPGSARAGRRRPGPSADPQRGRLGRRHAVEAAEGRAQELVKGGERQLRLRLHAARAQDLHVAGPLAGVLQQRGLADARLAPQHQRSAARLPGGVEQLADDGPLGIAAVEHPAILRRGR